MKKLKKSDISIKEWEFEFQQRSKNCVLMADLHCKGLFEQLPKQIQLDVDCYDYIFSNSDRGYVKTLAKKKVLKKMKVALQNEQYISYLLKNSIEQMEEFGRKVNFINSNVKSDVNHDELKKQWEILAESWKKMTPWFYIPWYASEENIFTDKVKNDLEKYRSQIEKIINFEEGLLLLIFPTKKTAFQKEHDRFFQLVAMAEGDNFFNEPKFKKAIKKYLDEFSWMPTFFFLPIRPLSEAQVIGSIKRAKLKGEYDKFKLKRKEDFKKKKIERKIVSLIENDVKLMKNIEDARELAWSLTAGVEEAHKAGSLLRPFLKCISRSIGVKLDEIQHLTSSEILSALDGEGVDHGEIEKRKVGYVYACFDGVTFISSGKEGVYLSEWFEKAVERVDENILIINGTKASTGKAEGIVRIAMTSDDSKLIKEGEILVCSMTSTAYVPAMKRAAAIVTDEGGLLCHAAIMSREFKKPCIIGTKIATKVLKNGDLVEVDAEKGIVKILDINK